MPTRMDVTTKMVRYYSNNADVEHNNHVKDNTIQATQRLKNIATLSDYCTRFRLLNKEIIGSRTV